MRALLAVGNGLRASSPLLTSLATFGLLTLALLAALLALSFALGIALLAAEARLVSGTVAINRTLAILPIAGGKARLPVLAPFAPVFAEIIARLVVAALPILLAVVARLPVVPVALAGITLGAAVGPLYRGNFV